MFFFKYYNKIINKQAFRNTFIIIAFGIIVIQLTLIQYTAFKIYIYWFRVSTDLSKLF